MKKPRPPRPPKILCGNTKNYILGVVSPSRLFKYATEIGWLELEGKNIEGELLEISIYLKDVDEYNLDLLLWKIEQRTATKEEYKIFRSQKKKLCENHIKY